MLVAMNFIILPVGASQDTEGRCTKLQEQCEKQQHKNRITHTHTKNIRDKIDKNEIKVKSEHIKVNTFV